MATNLERIQREEHDKVLTQLRVRDGELFIAVHFVLGWIEGTAGYFAVGKPAERLARIRGAIEAFNEFSERPAAPIPTEAYDTRDEESYAAGLEGDSSKEERP